MLIPDEGAAFSDPNAFDVFVDRAFLSDLASKYLETNNHAGLRWLDDAVGKVKGGIVAVAQRFIANDEDGAVAALNAKGGQPITFIQKVGARRWYVIHSDASDATYDADELKVWLESLRAVLIAMPGERSTPLQ